MLTSIKSICADIVKFNDNVDLIVVCSLIEERKREYISEYSVLEATLTGSLHVVIVPDIGAGNLSNCVT